MNRRRFLKNCGALSTALAAPRFHQNTDPGWNVVILQLSGGNDGLSTVIPHGDDDYHNARKSTRHAASSALRIDEYRGLHPDLKHLQRAWDEGQLGIIEGVGYEGNTRSHFRSMEVWHTARTDGRKSGDGWIGRLGQVEWSARSTSERVAHLGSRLPYSVYSGSKPTIAMESPTSYRWFGKPRGEGFFSKVAGLEPHALQAANHGRDQSLARIRSLLAEAEQTSDRIRASALRYQTDVKYPHSVLGANLHDAAAILQAGLGTRVISMEFTGFDTHAGQMQRHNGLMRKLDSALGAFLKDLQRSDVGRKTVVLVFSEFGRRFAENGSGGTDHGNAGPAFVLGPGIKGGLFGAHPSLNELDEGGDLKVTTDFRSLYATLLERALGVQQEAVLGARYPLLGFLV